MHAFDQSPRRLEELRAEGHAFDQSLAYLLLVGRDHLVHGRRDGAIAQGLEGQDRKGLLDLPTAVKPGGRQRQAVGGSRPPVRTGMQ